jgi:hypothetical protein
MSYDNLSQDAKDIEKNAADAEYQQMVQMANSGGGAGGAFVDYDEIKRKYDGKVSGYFEPFIELPDPSWFDEPIDRLRAAMGDLSHGQMTDPVNHEVFTANQKLSHIKSASGKLEDWTGAAADGFKTKFLDPFDDVSTNQFIALSVMKGALEAHQAVCKNAQSDIDKIAHSALDALDNLSSCSKDDWNFAFSVAIAVAAIGAVPFTAGASAAGIAVVGAAGAVGASGVAGVSANADGGGGSAEEIVNSMKTDIDKLAKEVRETEEKIAKALSGIADEVHNDQRAFVSARPKLAGMDDNELTGDNGLGSSS